MFKGQFRKFIEAKRKDNLRDFADIAIDDPAIDSVKSWEALENYLKSQGADASILDQAEYLWTLFHDQTEYKGAGTR